MGLGFEFHGWKERRERESQEPETLGSSIIRSPNPLMDVNYNSQQRRSPGQIKGIDVVSSMLRVCHPQVVKVSGDARHYSPHGLL